MTPQAATRTALGTTALLAGLVIASGTAFAMWSSTTCAEGGISASAQADGSVTLHWDEVASKSYIVERSDAGKAWKFLGSTNETTWTDTTTEPGVTYAYRIQPAPGALATTFLPYCIEVTAIPFLGAPLLAGLAIAGSVGAYALYRRRS